MLLYLMNVKKKKILTFMNLNMFFFEKCFIFFITNTLTISNVLNEK